MAKISVIIPVYNVEKYLHRCLDSVINQTYKDLEIILIDDGSTDNSLSICKEYAQQDNRIKVISQVNCGPSARNAGLKIASGDYIGFVDSDDWISSNFYEKLYNTLIEHDADISFCSVIRTNESIEKIRFQYTKSECAENIYDKIALAYFNEHRGIWNKLYRKSLFGKDLLFENMYYEDGLFTIIALYKSKKVVSVSDACYYYYVNPTSIVRKAPSLQKIQDKNVMRIKILNFATEHVFLISGKKNIPTTFKLSMLGITLWGVKETQKEKRYYLFGSILLFKHSKLH